jgi:hypothetical protein
VDLAADLLEDEFGLPADLAVPPAAGLLELQMVPQPGQLLGDIAAVGETAPPPSARARRSTSSSRSACAQSLQELLAVKPRCI